jgi:EAL and modified HD-GYP domain-containing signal transduction protein
MMLMADVGSNKPNELLNIAMIRAKACEHLSRALKIGGPDQAFTAGMISTFDALLDMPIESIVEMLPLSAELNDALTCRSGDIGKILTYVLAFEAGDSIPESVKEFALEANLAATLWAAATVDRI